MVLICISLKRKDNFLCYKFFRGSWGGIDMAEIAFTQTMLDGTKMMLVNGSDWSTKYICEWTQELDGRFVQQVKDRTECFDDHFHIGDRIVTDDMFGIGWNCLFTLGSDKIQFIMFLVIEGRLS